MNELERDLIAVQFLSTSYEQNASYLQKGFACTLKNKETSFEVPISFRDSQYSLQHFVFRFGKLSGEKQEAEEVTEVGGSFTHQTFFGYVVCAKTSPNTFLYHFWALGVSQSHYLGIFSWGRIWMISYGIMCLFICIINR